MSVLTNACAAMPLAASAEPGVEAEPAEPQQAGAERHEGDVVGHAALALGELAPADDEDRRQRGEAGAHVDHEAAGEVEHALLRQPAAAPDPVHERDVHEDAPEHQEPQVALELDPVGERAGDERRGDDGEHLLVHEVRLGRDVRRPRTRQVADARERRPAEVAEDAADVAREGERVAEEHPDRGDDAHRDERLHHDRKEVLAADQTPVEEREAWGHQRHERGADEDERSVARVDGESAHAGPSYDSCLAPRARNPQGSTSANLTRCPDSGRASGGDPLQPPSPDWRHSLRL